MARKLESKLLQYGLLLGVAYMLYQSASGIFSEVELTTTLLNLVITMFLVVLLVQSNKTIYSNQIAFGMHVVMMPVFYYYWKLYGGFSGTVPAIFCIYIGFIIATSYGLLKYITLVLYVILIIILIHFPEIARVSNLFGDGPSERLQLSIDFMAIAVIVALFVIFLKNTFLDYRNEISRRNRQLKRVAITLEQKNSILIAQQEEIHMINDNLESIIYKRIQNIEEKNLELSEYAFINAHMLRAPVCRILGLINLIEMEDPKADLSEIKKYATQVDGIIRNINQAVN